MTGGGLLRRSKDSLREVLGRRAPRLARRLTNFHLLEDRVFMEEVILPFFRDDPATRRLLFVGTDWYTKSYEDFFRDKDYWTLEIDPTKRRFGSKRHITASLTELEAHAAPASFDAIICNGVFYTGAMDRREQAEPAFDACWRSLRPGGWFVLGWNDTPALRPYPPGESDALKAFKPAAFPPTGTAEHRTATEHAHVYNFFVRPRDA